MKRKITLAFALLSWFAIIGQYFLMIENRVTSFAETTLRFMSFFTILTNSLVALYFTFLFISKGAIYRFCTRPGILSAITSYILVVGLVYQFVLRSIWTPTGLQMVVNELLHSIIPLQVLFFWYRYEYKKELEFVMIKNWVLFPTAYLICVLVRGFFSGFYPYPFLNVYKLGVELVICNVAQLIVVFVFIFFVMIAFGKKIGKNQIV